MPSEKPHISIVNYLNTLPFLYGMQSTGFINRVELHKDIPAICAEKTLKKDVSIALVPVAILKILENYRIISDYCIGADGKVDSVKLFSEVPLERIEYVLMDYQSRTSVQLLRILLKDYWKSNPIFLDTTEGFEGKINGTTAALIIGDRTFSLQTKFPYSYDLAEYWKKMTGMPFVFAVWVAVKEVETDLERALNKALAFGVNHINEALLEDIREINNFDRADYLLNKINYRLDEPKRDALKLFLHYLE